MLLKKEEIKQIQFFIACESRIFRITIEEGGYNAQIALHFRNDEFSDLEITSEERNIFERLLAWEYPEVDKYDDIEEIRAVLTKRAKELKEIGV